MNWMPIETAPRDGREVLIYSGAVDVALFEYGQWWSSGCDEYGNDRRVYPTHWMPLPPPPEEA
jgi:hypothetical protein